jgi:hypothetical protein
MPGESQQASTTALEERIIDSNLVGTLFKEIFEEQAPLSDESRRLIQRMRGLILPVPGFRKGKEPTRLVLSALESRVKTSTRFRSVILRDAFKAWFGRADRAALWSLKPSEFTADSERLEHLRAGRDAKELSDDCLMLALAGRELLASSDSADTSTAEPPSLEHDAPVPAEIRHRPGHSTNNGAPPSSERPSGWLHFLAEQPADAAIWDELEEFTKELAALREEKKTEREKQVARAETLRRLEALRENCRTELTFLKVELPAGALSLDATAVGRAAELAAELHTALDHHRALRQQHDDSLDAESARLEALRQTRDRCHKLFSELRPLLVPSGDELKAPAKPLTPPASPPRPLAEAPHHLPESATLGVPANPANHASEFAATPTSARVGRNAAESVAVNPAAGAAAQSPALSMMSPETALDEPPPSLKVIPTQVARAAPVEPLHEDEVAPKDTVPAVSGDGEAPAQGAAANLASEGLGISDWGEYRKSDELAREALHLPEEGPRPASVGRVAWSLIAEGQLGLAQELAHSARSAQLYVPWGPSAEIIRGLCLSRLVRSSEDSASQALLETIAAIDLPSATTEAGRAGHLLCAALALRPALLARASGAEGLLRSLDLDPGAASIRQLRAAIIDYTELGLELSPAVLGGVREHAAWQAQLGALQSDCARWLERARQQTLNYAAATNVWHHLLDNGSSLAEVVETIAAGDQLGKSAVERSLASLADERDIRKLIQTTDEGIRGRQARCKPITDKALKTLTERIKDVHDLGRRWLDLVDATPANMASGAFRQERAEACRRRVLAAIRTNLGDLNRVGDHGSLPLAAAAAAVRNALSDLERLFDPTTALGPPLPMAAFLRGDLLRVPALELDEAWDVCGTPQSEIVLRILEALARGLPSWSDAVEEGLKRRDFLTVQRILDLPEASLPSSGIDVEKFAERSAEQRERAQAELLEEKRRCAIELEQAVSLDLLTEDERDGLVSRLETFTEREYLQFGPPRRELTAVRAAIADKRSQRTDEIRRRIESERIAERFPEAHRRITAALQRHDFPTAQEYVDAAVAGQPLPEERGPDVFADLFFPKFVKEASALEKIAQTELVGAVRAGRRIDPIDMTDVPGAQRDEAARFLAAWQKVKQKADTPANLKALLEGIGFRDVKLESTRMDNERVQRIRLIAAPFHDRDICVVPQFGSMARGHYQLVVVWGRPPESELLELVGTNTAPPLLVLYMGRMTEQRRHDLARLCRERRRQLVVVDESLVVFLAMQRGSRLGVMFRCALPFTVAQPYVATAGLVPPEMFFGRSREEDAILNPQGSSLVYGGRQLGKTALLRHVERQGDPERGLIVRWVDLKQAGVGLSRPASDLWDVIGEHLVRDRVLARKTTAPERISQNVAEWLKMDPVRRIVLLLDEADAFLAADRDSNPKHPYPTLLQLKSLVDRTERRFKFVLAGLHDVQRTARDPNTPLAHLGEPLCIGPLLKQGESLEARRLIEEPLAALGYRFESPDLPTRILSHTNYFPSLIQLFCWHLLEHVAAPRLTSFDARTTPPYVITSRHVDEAYQIQQLRRAIRDRFTWTLDLDPRYRLIALLIALESLSERENLALGFAARSIRDLALEWWPDGFRNDSSLETFSTVLDEMTGLGVLRKTETNRYALRSANVLNLLGSKAEIDAQLEETITRPPPKPLDFLEVRRPDPEQPLSRSPLTVLQESRLLRLENGVCTVFGVRASGRDRIPRFLELAASDAKVHRLDNLPSLQDLQRELNRLIELEEERCIAVVDATSAWSETWVEKARGMLARRPWRNRTVRVVFVGDPLAAWQWEMLPTATLSRLEEDGGVERLYLTPWKEGAVQLWLQEAVLGFPENKEHADKLLQHTGYWGELLLRVAERCSGQPNHSERGLCEYQAALDPPCLESLFELVPESMPVLRAIAEYGGAGNFAEVCELAELDPAQAKRVVCWAEGLGLIAAADGVSPTKSKDGRWTVDALIARRLGVG